MKELSGSVWRHPLPHRPGVLRHLTRWWGGESTAVPTAATLEEGGVGGATAVLGIAGCLV